MMLIVALMLAYGPLDWSFPWWIWALAGAHTVGEGATSGQKRGE
jgi:hypothetical protein